MSKWAYSFNDESYYGSYNSREEAIQAAKREIEAEKEDPVPFPTISEKLYTGEKIDPVLRWRDMAEYYIESMQENLDDDCGGTWSGVFSEDQVTNEDIEALDKKLNTAVEKGTKERHIEPGFFLIDNDTVMSVDISDLTKEAREDWKKEKRNNERYGDA